MIRLDDIRSDKVVLEVYECKCGFHIGIDSTFLEQVSDVSLNCPSCDAEMKMYGGESSEISLSDGSV